MSTPLATAAFLAIVAFVTVAFVAATSRSAPDTSRAWTSRRWILIALAWLVVTALPAVLGLAKPSGPVPPQGIMFVLLVLGIGFAMSPTGERIARTTPLWALVGFQGFRLPLELVLHRWVEAGVAPPQMTWSGQNPDILAGVLALVAIPAVRRKPAFAWVPTLVGLALLANIGRVVVTSFAGPLLQFPDVLTLPARFPHVWIGSVCVVGALVGHVLAIRALRTRPGSL